MSKPYAAFPDTNEGKANAMRRKADWHVSRAGGRSSASMERAGQLHYRANLQEKGLPPPDRPLVKHIAGRVEPEFKNKPGRPTPEEFAWR